MQSFQMSLLTPHKVKSPLSSALGGAVQAMVPEWQSANLGMPECPVIKEWQGQVAACIDHWVQGWAWRQNGQAINMLGHDAR